MAKVNISIEASVNQNGQEWVNLIQMTIIYIIVDVNPLEEME